MTTMKSPTKPDTKNDAPTSPRPQAAGAPPTVKSCIKAGLSGITVRYPNPVDG